MKVVSFAPAKLTLLGEHAVVYGKNALAMAINKGIKTIIEENKESDLLIESADVLIQGVKLKVNEGKTEAYSSINFSLSVLSYVIASIRKVEERIGDKVRGINIKIRSELPVRAGLGTSASVVVSTVAGLMEFFGKSFSREEIAKISWEVEREVQGTASPMDTYTSSLGGILLIRSEGEKAFFERLERLPQLPIVIGYVNKEISTKELVEIVREKYKKYDFIRSIMDVINEISLKGKQCLVQRDYNCLGELMNVNHGLLDAIGVSSKLLNDMVYLARLSGALGSKMTGAGGGGSMIALVNEEVSDKVKMAIKMAGGRVIEAIQREVGVEVSRV